jgi:SAM-dependent methyltransferase
MNTSKADRSRGRGGARAEYDAWAKYYDLVNTGLPGEAEFYVGQAVRIGGRALELGCGTGRIAIPMAMSGLDVTGLDISTAMLALCRAKRRAVGKLSGKLRVVRADMRDFQLDGLFDFVAIAYRTFMHLKLPQEQRACLEAVHRHLADDGVLILNCWMPSVGFIAPLSDKFSGLLQFVGRYPLEENGLNLVHYCATSCEPLMQLIVEDHVFHTVDEDGTVHATETLSMERVWITPREMGNLVRLCGFEPEAVFGDFDCNPLTAESSEQIWVLRKAGARG